MKGTEQCMAGPPAPAALQGCVGAVNGASVVLVGVAYRRYIIRRPATASQELVRREDSCVI